MYPLLCTFERKKIVRDDPTKSFSQEKKVNGLLPVSQYLEVSFLLMVGRRRRWKYPIKWDFRQCCSQSFLFSLSFFSGMEAQRMNLPSNETLEQIMAFAAGIRLNIT